MFFYFFPLGVSSVKKIHVWMAWCIVGLLVYRALLTFIFPQMQFPITSYYINPVITDEFVSASLQSLITPTIWPGWASIDHRIFCLIGTVSTFVFWLLFASSFEMKLGRKLFVSLLIITSVGAFGICMIPSIELNPTLWLGQIVTLFFTGLAFGMFALDDVKIHYHSYIIFFDHNIGNYEIPAFAPLFVLFILMFIPMSTFWYSDSDIEVPMREAMVNPLGWATVITIFGSALGVIYIKYIKPPKEE